jgi:hypothetical protein
MELEANSINIVPRGSFVNWDAQNIPTGFACPKCSYHF